jgi:hypothetical protein
MTGRKQAMLTLDYPAHSADRLSLKHQLVTAVANGNDLAAEEIRMLLKINRSEQLRGEKRH